MSTRRRRPDAALRVERRPAARHREHHPQAEGQGPVRREPEVLEALGVVGRGGEEDRDDDGCRSREPLAAGEEVGGHGDERVAEEEVDGADGGRVAAQEPERLDAEHVDDVELGEERGVLAEGEAHGVAAPEPPGAQDLVDLGQHDGAVADEGRRDSRAPLPHPQRQHRDDGRRGARRLRPPRRPGGCGRRDPPRRDDRRDVAIRLLAHRWTHSRKSGSSATAVHAGSPESARSSGRSRSARTAVMPSASA